MSTPLRVLLVEDSDDDAQLLIREIRRGGYDPQWERVETRAAMQAALNNHVWDLIISDHTMPQFSSMQALEVLKNSGQDLPFILSSGSIGEDAAVAALKAGAHDFLIKGNWVRLTPAIQRELRDAETRRERKKATESLRAAEERLSGILELAADAVIVIDEHQNIVLFNDSAEHIFGYPADEVMGQTFHILLPARFAKIYQEHINTFSATPETARRMGKRLEIFGRRKDGSEFPAEASVSKLEQGDEVTFTVILRDITERKRADDEIKRQLSRLNSLREIDQAITSSFDIKVVSDIVLQQVISQLNVDAALILQLDSRTQMMEYVSGRGFQSGNIQHIQPGLDGELSGTVVRKRKPLHLSDLKNTVSKLPQALQSENFTDYYGIPLMAKDDVKGVLEVYHRAPLNLNKDWLGFLGVLARQAAIAIDSAQLFEDLQRANAELEKRVAERTEELIRTNTELEKANRAKSDFLATMSHELRTPLNSILGLSESMLEQRRDPLSEYQQQALELIGSSGQHLLELINDVLDLSKIEAGMLDYYPEILNTGVLCQSCLAFVREQAIRKSVRLDFDEDKADFEIYADPRRLKQILVNLLTNAVKFTPPQGKVILEVHADEEEDLIQISVTDTGIGIAKEDFKQLFQPFKQVDSKLNRQFEGTGLGLALVQKLTDLHGGSVQVESRVGIGSRFTINIPWGRMIIAQQEALESVGEKTNDEKMFDPTGSPDKTREKTKVLLAEDNMSNILTVGEYLKSHGYEVFIAHDGVEAIELAQNTEPAVILMDIQMPVMDGLEAIRRLREDERFNPTPIIALTALAMPGDRELCLEAGANEYMSKPVSLKELIKTINRLLSQTEE